MTVAELIEQLADLPQHHEVKVRTFDEDLYDIVDRDPNVRQHANHGGPWVTL